jgi:hypothetical protein
VKIIIVPDDGREYTLVPKVAVETLHGIRDADWRKWDELASPEEFVRWAKARANHAAILAAADPPCKVVELPRRKPMNRNLSDYGQGYIDGHDACLDEIERRAK